MISIRFALINTLSFETARVHCYIVWSPMRSILRASRISNELLHGPSFRSSGVYRALTFQLGERRRETPLFTCAVALHYYYSFAPRPHSCGMSALCRGRRWRRKIFMRPNHICMFKVLRIFFSHISILNADAGLRHVRLKKRFQRSEDSIQFMNILH